MSEPIGRGEERREAYGLEQRETLISLACASIAHGWAHRPPAPLRTEGHAAPLREPRATFVTLTLRGELRGCMGSLEADKPLVNDVADNAYASAFSDPRFLPLSRGETDGLTLRISVLSPPRPLSFDSEQALIAQLRPGLDGLMLEAGGRFRSTFLPVVWETLSRPEEFLRHLKLKAGLPGDYWSDSLRISRYTTESFGAEFREAPYP